MARIVTVRVKDIKVTLCNLHPYNLYKLCMQTVAIIIDINATLNPTQQQFKNDIVPVTNKICD